MAVIESTVDKTRENNTVKTVYSFVVEGMPLT